MKHFSAILSATLISLITHAHADIPAKAKDPRQPKTLTLIIKAPADTAGDARLFVTGNASELCFWKTECIELKPIGYKLYQAEIAFSEWQNSIEFKITRGTWDQEAAGANGTPLPNYFVQLRAGNQLIINSLETWKDGQHYGVTGNLKTFWNFYSPQLKNNRTIRVWLPPQYYEQPDKRYPVLYMHDGQNVFDPQTSSFGTEWGIDETLTRLIRQGRTSGAIVVAADCNENREDEYNIQGNGERYAQFLIQTLKPWVDQNFRTLPDRQHTFTMGSSMGALISLGLAWNHADVFSAAGAVSLPAFYGNNLAHSIISSSPVPQETRLYIDHGDYGGDEEYLEPGTAFIKQLKEQGFPSNQLLYGVYSYADHHESDWARRAEVPLLWLLENQGP